MQVLDQKNSAVSTGVLFVYQKECGISNSKKIVTPSFGPCHVLTGHDPKTKYTFLAHIDDLTDVQSIHTIFSTLKKLGVDVNDLTGVRLMGGYKMHEESNLWAHKIIEVLWQEGMSSKIDYVYFQKKVEMSAGIPVGSQTHFCGAQLVPETGAFNFFDRPWMKLEREQQQRDNALFQGWCAKAKINLAALSPNQKAELASQLAMDVAEIPLKITVS